MLQYTMLLISLGAMYSSLAYFRAYASVDFVAQLATILLLFSWITPIESSLGNLVFKTAYSQKKKTTFPKELPLYIRAIIFGIIFGIIFRVYPAGGYEPSILVSILVCIFFSMRLIENILKISLVSLGEGLNAQMVVNFFTFTKWSLCLIIFILGVKNFSLFMLCNIALGLLSIFVLYKAKKNIPIFFTERINNKERLTLKDDLISILSITIGVFGFQIDKIIVGFTSTPANYGQYVMLSTMAFIAPYLLSPIFTIYQKKLISSKEPDAKISPIGRSIIRFPALIIMLSTLLILTILDGYFLDISETIFTKQLGFIALASYLNCLAHIYYLKYQIDSDFNSILKQNLWCLIFAITVSLIIIYLDSELYSLVIVFAGLGQYLYGLFNEYNVNKNIFNFKDCFIFLNILPCAAIYLLNPNFISFIVIIVSTLFSGLLLEIWALNMNLRQYFYEAKKFLI